MVNCGRKYSPQNTIIGFMEIRISTDHYEVFKKFSSEFNRLVRSWPRSKFIWLDTSWSVSPEKYPFLPKFRNGGCQKKFWIPNFLEKPGHRKWQNFPKFLIFRRGPVKNSILTKIANFRQNCLESTPWKSGVLTQDSYFTSIELAELCLLQKLP